MPPCMRRWPIFCVIAGVALFTFLSSHEAQHFLLGLRTGNASDPSERTNHHRVDWRNVPLRHPVQSIIPIPTGQPVAIPRVQHEFLLESPQQRYERELRRDAVKESFEHSWEGYKNHAWLQDEVGPISGEYNNEFGGWGATLVDTLDTLWIMGMKDEFVTAVAALKKIDFSTSETELVNVFETTIRYVGGLLAAYDVSEGQYPELLEKAVQLGDMLYTAFDTPNRMPVLRWDWKNGALNGSQEAPSQALVAEIGSLTLEFTRLTQLSGDPRYFDAVQRISDQFEEQQNRTRLPGMWPVWMDAKSMEFNKDRTFTFGAMADSVYEYLPKQFMLLGGLVDQYRKLYEGAIETAKKHVFFRPLTRNDSDILLSGTAKTTAVGTIKLVPEGQHLACFTGGMVGLASKIFDRPDELDIARKLVDGCIWAYESMPSGIMPEQFHVVPCEDWRECAWDEARWHNGVANQQKKLGESRKDAEDRADDLIKSHNLAPGFSNYDDPRYILRPEAIESIFILYRITGDRTLQDSAWTMFQAIEKHTRTDIGYASISDVTNPNAPKYDKMESFWTAETLKYFYLIFSEPDLISLDEYVFNTEAHPLKRPQA